MCKEREIDSALGRHESDVMDGCSMDKLDVMGGCLMDKLDVMDGCLRIN